jgi:hypothetical protein
MTYIPKHTPGPWTFCESMNDFSGHYIWSNGRLIAGTNTTKNEVTEEDHANARLIAAAPELLAALKSLLESIENVDFSMLDDHGRQYDRIPWAQAEAGIAKATGEEEGQL